MTDYDDEIRRLQDLARKQKHRLVEEARLAVLAADNSLAAGLEKAVLDDLPSWKAAIEYAITQDSTCVFSGTRNKVRIGVITPHWLLGLRTRYWPSPGLALLRQEDRYQDTADRYTKYAAKLQVLLGPPFSVKSTHHSEEEHFSLGGYEYKPAYDEIEVSW